MKITVNEEVYDVVKEKEMNGCIGCFLCNFIYDFQECFEIKGINCIEEKVIFLKVPDSLKNCENCGITGSEICLKCNDFKLWEAKE